ncbi:uncharacterized protein LOC119078353 isoform X2 [Bradysia coprophila]|uniref:uncharacterized protein LOC119078353 isoform X2 n=1 Tax=Bradysia coprophila TaxID=38358 RepID=UPI00187D9356|nr:uncharacterized protein LOC119078353 isoform X2 [Bradysia coprophila]
MEHSNDACSSDEFVDVEIQPNAHLPKEMLEEIFRNLHNGRDLANARLVCRIWFEVATPLYLSKIDDIEVNFSPTHRQEAIYRRILSDKYRERQRQVPNRKLSEADRDEIHRAVSVECDLVDDNCSIAKYCNYIEAGGTVQYTNFNFVAINISKSTMAHRFFSLCGEHVKTLTVSDCGKNYWYCDSPKSLCASCADLKSKSSKCVLNLPVLGTLMQTYCPNVGILTIDYFSTKKQDDHATGSGSQSSESKKDESQEEVDEDDSDDNDSDDNESEDEEFSYVMVFGDVWSENSANQLELEQKYPPAFRLHNIHTIRVVDKLVVSLHENVFVYQLFLHCPNVASASNFGKMEDAFESHAFDFVRALVTNAKMENFTELFLRTVDATTIHTLFERHKDRMHLKLLKVNHLVTHLAESSFLQFLESQAATLETMMCGLSQKRNPSWSNEAIRFPGEMPKLTHLRIGLGKQEQPERPPKKIAPINWATQFPSLKTLMLPEFATNVTVDSFFEHPYSLDGLSRLELPAKLTQSLMERAGLLFPNVTELAVGFQIIDSMRLIWTMWKKLKSLHLSVIYYDERDSAKHTTAFLNLDELLTGFDKSQMEMAKDGNRDVIGEPKFPSISKLTDLRELTIFGASYRTDSRRYILNEVNCIEAQQNAVSDISVQNALIKLPCLKYLDISYHLYNISPSADMELCNHLSLVHEDIVATRNNFTIMSNYRGREEAHAMCRLDTMYKDK